VPNIFQGKTYRLRIPLQSPHLGKEWLRVNGYVHERRKRV
jgi:hypothetical protein